MSSVEGGNSLSGYRSTRIAIACGGAVLAYFAFFVALPVTEDLVWSLAFTLLGLLVMLGAAAKARTPRRPARPRTILRCPLCKYELGEGSKECPNCGAKFSTKSS